MYIKLEDGVQRSLVEKAVKKAGNYRNLSKILKIPRSSIFNYINRKVMLEDSFIKIIDFLKLTRENFNP